MFSVPDFLDVQQSAKTLEHVAFYQNSGTMLTEGGDPERVLGAAVTADYFSVLRVKPVLGRVFTHDEDKPGAPAVVVLSYGLWQRRFGDRKSTRLNSSHLVISYAVFCLKKQ